MNITRQQPEKILMRTEPCRCGCKGRDHKRYITRKITDVKRIWVSPTAHGKFLIQTTYSGWIKYNGQQMQVVFSSIYNTETKKTFGGRWISQELEGKV